MDASYEDLAMMRAREPGLQPTRRHPGPPARHTARRRVASTLRRVANRLDS